MISKEEWQARFDEVTAGIRKAIATCEAKPAKAIDFGEGFESDDEALVMGEFSQTSGGLLYRYNEDEVLGVVRTIGT